MASQPPHTPAGFDRRGFLGLSGAALICGIGGHEVTVKTVADVAKADALARRVPKPKIPHDPVDGMSFQTPQPQPGGQKREYWIQARPAKWDVAPTHRDEWMNHPVAGRTKFTALVYQRYTDGFAEPIGPASMPGPTFEGEVGDTIVVHFRNGDDKFEQPLTVHPHGVRYNPEYDGAYLGEFTRAGGFVAPGEEFTYTYECTPDSVGVWPYHDHGPNHTINSLRGLFGLVIVRPKGERKPDVEQALVMHSLPPQITGIERLIQCFNGRSFAGNTPTVRAKVGQDVAFYVYAADSAFHTFHIHGHRWKDPSGVSVDCPTVGPNESIVARWTEDNPGRWLYHCHVAPHMTMGMAGWYIVEP